MMDYDDTDITKGDICQLAGTSMLKAAKLKNALLKMAELVEKVWKYREDSFLWDNSSTKQKQQQILKDAGVSQ
jgi:hypothetical protein